MVVGDAHHPMLLLLFVIVIDQQEGNASNYGEDNQNDVNPLPCSVRTSAYDRFIQDLLDLSMETPKVSIRLHCFLRTGLRASAVSMIMEGKLKFEVFDTWISCGERQLRAKLVKIDKDNGDV